MFITEHINLKLINGGKIYEGNVLPNTPAEAAIEFKYYYDLCRSEMKI